MESSMKTWQIWTLMVVLLFTAIIFLYQEPVIKGEKLSIADVKSQGIIFEKNRTEYKAEFGENPQWYPYIFGGMPFQASGTYRLQYTLETLYKIIPQSLRNRLAVGFTFNILAGGIFMLLLLRSYGLSYVAAFTGSMAFIFSTKVLGTPHTNRIVTFIHLPLILYALRMAVKSRKWVYFVLLGGAVGSQIGSYHPQVAFYGLMLIGLYTLYRFGWSIKEKESWSSIGQFAGMWAISLGVGYLMASVVLLPMQEYLPYSIRGAGDGTGGGSAGLSFGYATSWSFSWDELFTFIIPSFSGHSGNTYWGDSPFTSYPHYLGVVTVILAIAGFAWGRKRKDFWFFVGLIVITLLIAMGRNFAPLSKFLLAYLPYFNKFREPSMILILTIMGIAVVAGWGMEAILERVKLDATEKTVALLQKLLIGTGAVLLLAILFKNDLAAFMDGVYRNADLARDRMGQYSSTAQAQAFYRIRFGMFHRDLMLACIWTIASLTLLWAAFDKRLSVKTMAITIPLLLFTDLVIQGRMVIPEMFERSSLSERVPRETNAIKFLKSDHELYRVFPLNLITTNEYAYFDISSIGGYHAAKMSKYQEIIDARLFNSFNFLRTANTKYFISRQQINHPSLIESFTDDQNFIYRFNDFLPRAYAVGEYVLADTKEKTFEILQSDSFDVGKTVILHELIPDMEKGNGGTAKITSWQPQRYEIEVSMEGPGFLCLSEAWYPPGWSATVDGSDVDILRANHTFQAVPLSSGQHLVVFSFESKKFAAGVALSRSIFGLIILLLLGNALYQNKAQILNKFRKP
ncbi:MAG: YfhO family protein [Candidatus Marinimicrobia bacterium]|nr:YfhO family protein [Candidatus Neomarinimicrobiota bacterium]